MVVPAGGGGTALQGLERGPASSGQSGGLAGGGGPLAGPGQAVYLAPEGSGWELVCSGSSPGGAPG